MKPDFALNLSSEGIALLKRVPGGWAVLSEVALEADLAAEMARMRAEIVGGDGAAPQVKLVLPEDQIKFLETEAPDGDPQDAARTALEGETPYAVSELRVDATVASGRLHVAAVAGETLQEAEDFALEHGFAPVGFVAAHSNGFGREISFGAAGSWAGSPLEPEVTEIRIVPMPATEAPVEPGPAAETKAATETTPEDDATASEVETEPAAPPPVEPDGTESPASEDIAEETAAPEPSVSVEATPETAAVADLESETADSTDPAESAAAELSPQPRRERPADPLAAAPAENAEPPGRKPAKAAPTFVSMRARRDAPPPPPQARTGLRATPAAPPAKDPGPANAAPAPRHPDASVLESLTREPPVAPPAPKPAAATAPKTKTPAPKRRSIFGAGADAAEAPRPKDRPIGTKTFAKSAIARPAPASVLGPGVGATAGTAVDSPGLAASARDMRAPNLPGKPAPKTIASRKNAVAPKAAPKPETEREQMTVFGARRKDNYVGGKPKYLGLILTSALLIFLLGVAAWASVFLEDGLARFFRSGETNAVAALPEPALIEPEVTARVEPPAPAADPPVEEARLAIDSNTAGVADTAPAPLATPEPVPALSAAEAEATYAATGIWLRAPEAPSDIRESGSGDVYVASIDPDVPQFDAMALPEAPAERDAAMAPRPIPAPAGTPFDLDDRGLVRATPEGAINPDRVRIFAGLPPAVPPRREQALAPVVEAIPERPDGSRPAPTEIFQRLQEFDDFRPATRPGDLQEQNDRANLTGFTRTELAAQRPAARPEALKEEFEQDVTATAQAVTVSERPSQRPSDIARIVAAVQAQQQSRQQAAPQEPTRVAAVAPRTVAPSVPSNTSVSRAATEENAINLRRINLIGIYGQPSSRRALVRLPNGRYEKVSVGDRLDGGRVSAIGEDQLRYVKRGRNVTLTMPRG